MNRYLTTLDLYKSACPTPVMTLSCTLYEESRLAAVSTAENMLNVCLAPEFWAAGRNATPAIDTTQVGAEIMLAAA